MTQPGAYFANNVAAVVTLLNRLVQHGVPRLVFSSTAAVYGEPDASPVAESAPVRPNNPYGESKAAVERMLHWYGLAHWVRFAVLRYFNAAGASGDRGEDHHPETHLIPLALRAARGEGPGLTVFGSDYPTIDGTAVRDYVHVSDLAEAHLLALDSLDAAGSLVCNLGSESGYSVRQVVETVRSVTGATLPVQDGPRRPGDSPTTVADADLARRLLRWTPRRGLADMVTSAWEWRNRHPSGYGS
jgi:UDP-glucose 4-epimerase